MLISTLKQIGLSEKEAKIYLASIELGETTIKEIAKKSGVKRTTIYDIIDDMINAGYIKKITTQTRTKFIAISPKKLKIILKKRESLLNQILPQLNTISNVEKAKPKVWFFEGVKGLEKAYDDALGYKNTIIRGWASDDILNILSENWANNYIKQRSKNNVEARLIIPSTDTLVDYSSKNTDDLRSTKIINAEKYPFNIEINIYKDRVAMISAKDKIAVIIESKPISSTMKMIFNLCWDNLP